MGKPSQNYAVLPKYSIWCRTILLAVRHNRAHPALTPANKAGTRFTSPEGWMAELT